MSDAVADSADTNGSDAPARSAAPASERLPMLEAVLRRHADLLQLSLRRYAGDDVVVTADPATVHRYGDYIGGLTPPTLFCVVRIEGTATPCLATARRDLVAAISDLLLGAGSRPYAGAPDRGFTMIERALAERFVRMVLADLATAFQPVIDVKLRLDKIETSPRFAAVIPDANTVHVARLRLRLGERAADLDLVFPSAAIEPLRDCLGQGYLGDRLGHDEIWERHLTRELLASHMRVTAVLDRPTVPIASIVRWEVGSTLMLDVQPTSPVTVYCGATPMFATTMGRHKDRVVVRIDGPAET